MSDVAFYVDCDGVRGNIFQCGWGQLWGEREARVTQNKLITIIAQVVGGRGGQCLGWMGGVRM